LTAALRCGGIAGLPWQRDRQGLLVRDAGNSYLATEGVVADPESPMSHLLGS